MENENKNVAPVEKVVTDSPVAEKANTTVAPQNGDQKGTKRFDRNNNNQRGGRRFDRNGGRRFNREPKEYEERVVYINKVCKVVKGGKRLKFSALVVVGNYKGKYGFAMGKSAEVPDAIKKSVDKAKRNIHFIKFAKANSIAHDTIGKFGATEVFLKPAPEGTGIIAGGPVRAILELAGVKNVYSKVYGSRTSINVVRATVKALDQLKDYKSVQELRGLVAVEGGKENVK
jgi:ribosomal protein S5, bacterial/organelle type